MRLSKFLPFGCAALAAVQMPLTALAQGEPGAQPPGYGVFFGAFVGQFILVMGLIFVALLGTKKIASWVDKLRAKRKK